MRPFIAFRVLSVVLICLPVLVPVGLQALEPPPVGVEADGWKSWSMYLDETTPPRGSGLDQQEYSGLLETIQRIAVLFRRLPVLNPPQAAELISAAQADALARGDYDALEAARERGLATVGRHLRTLESELAGLSAEEKAAPAYGFESNPAQYWLPARKPKRPSLLMDRNDRNALPLLAPNPDFFRRDLPPGAIQSLTIINRLRGEFLEGMEKDFDWTALIRMVR